jgi:hypothetical protein
VRPDKETHARKPTDHPSPCPGFPPRAHAGPAAVIAAHHRRLAAAGAAAAALALAGCAGAAHAPPARGGAGPFAWLGAGAAPASWPRAALPGGGSLARPPGWAPMPGDHGTVSFARRSRGGRITGYLNATPRSGPETLRGWARFRVAHNALEGDRDVRPVAAARGLRAGPARGSCVIDDYTTSRSVRYREIACLLASPRVAAVVVGAAPPQAWGRQRAVLERAIADFAAS